MGSLYDLLFLNCLANSVTGTQQATVVLATNSGHEAWVSLCNKNESKHSISAVSLIYRMISVIKWDHHQDPDPRWAVAELGPARMQAALQPLLLQQLLQLL